MSVRKRLHSLERKANAADELERPVTFIEMAHGIRDELWRKGKSPRRLRKAREKLEAAYAKFHESWSRDVARKETVS